MIQGVKGFVALCVAVCVMAVVAAPRRALGGDLVATMNGVTIKAPRTVYEGQPFFVRITSEKALDAAEMVWQEKRVPLDVAPAAGGGCEAVALLGVGLQRNATSQPLRVTAHGTAGDADIAMVVAVARKKYPEQKLNVDGKFVDLSATDMARATEERKLVVKALETITPRRFWLCPFVRPVPGAVTSDYGLRRIYNGQPRNPHSGVDFRAAMGSPVHAAAAGRVVLLGDFFFGGNEVFIDHGQGVVSVYVHMSEVMVKDGQEVKAGDVVGLVGSSGRATGPHLHFGLNVLRNAIDPMPLFEQRCGERQ
ncbi:MAG: M23 family metallopeptidase [Desulfovibrionaceae bacterium]